MSRAVHASLPISKLVKQQSNFSTYSLHRSVRLVVGRRVLNRLISFVNTLFCVSLFSGQRRVSASGGRFIRTCLTLVNT